MKNLFSAILFIIIFPIWGVFLSYIGLALRDNELTLLNLSIFLFFIWLSFFALLEKNNYSRYILTIVICFIQLLIHMKYTSNIYTNNSLSDIRNIPITSLLFSINALFPTMTEKHQYIDRHPILPIMGIMFIANSMMLTNYDYPNYLTLSQNEKESIFFFKHANNIIYFIASACGLYTLKNIDNKE